MSHEIRASSACRPSAPRSSAQTNQSIQRGLDCLLAVVEAEGPVGSREVARMLGMDPTKANRMLRTLAGIGLASQSAKRKYLPGPGLHVLAALSLRGSRLLPVAFPHLKALGAELRRKVALGVLWRRQVCYLYHGAVSPDSVASIAGHHLYPAEQSSIGRILLGSLPELEVRNLYENDRALLKPLLADLRSTRARGYGLSSTVPCSCAVAIGEPAFAGLAVIDCGSEDLPPCLPSLRRTAAAIASEYAQSLSRLDTGNPSPAKERHRP